MRRIRVLIFGAGSMAAVLCLAVVTSAQTAGEQAVSANQVKPSGSAATATKVVLAPAMTQFRKAGIGTAADDLKEAWGKPEVEDKTGFIYEFSDKEMAQIAIDAAGKVDTIAVTYKDGTGAPKAEDVFGPSEKIVRKDNGTVFHMVRYPEAGYWVSYSSQGDGKTVTIMYKKI